MKITPSPLKITPSSFVTDPEMREKAKDTLKKGEDLILVRGGSHDEKAISDFLSLSDFQKDVALGAAAGSAVGVGAGLLVDLITHENPAAGILGKLLLGILGGVVGGKVAQKASAVARQTPTGKAATGRKVLDQSPAVHIAYDPQAGHLIARLTPQSTK